MSGSEALLGTLLLLLLCSGFLETSEYLYTEVIVPSALLRRYGPNTEKEISYLIRIKGINRIVHLQQNSFIVAKMPFHTFNIKGERQVDHPHIKDNCYYSGYVEDVPDSDVVLSTCTGLWGYIQMDSLIYEIQPIEDSPTFQHLIYLAAPKQHEPCRGIPEDQDELESPSNIKDPRANPSFETWMKDPASATARYLEYYVVCDRTVYQWGNRNKTQLMLQMLQSVSVLHHIYRQVGLRIILIGMEMWTERDYPTVSQMKLAKTLERFYNYATFELQHHVHFDHATIYTFMGEPGSIGMSLGEHFCVDKHVSVSAVKTSFSTTQSGISAAHELGHSLGLIHDDSRDGNVTDCICNCTSNPGHCIMYSGIVACLRLSNCSKNTYYEFLQKPEKTCLQNQPKEEEAVRQRQGQTCGNGIVEGDEECDCGLLQDSGEVSPLPSSTAGIPEKPEPEKLAIKTSSSSLSMKELRLLNECQENGCCRSDCKLPPGVDCLHGRCCKNCKFAAEGTPCRKASSECDLPEFCTGKSAKCPWNVYKQNGMPCGIGDTCYLGKCNDLHQHCRALFGKDAKRAPLSCFKRVNMRGDRTGNCGKGKQGYKKCKEGDVLCGRIQCTNIKKIPVFSPGQAVLQTPVGNILCWSIEFQERLDVYDIGATQDGAVCGAGKICINSSCIHATVLNYSCDFNQCNNRGVCNNRRNCHCTYGWAPPLCEGKGYGGSVDSGPPPKHKLPTNIIIGATVGAVSFLLMLSLVKKFVLPFWLTRKEKQMDSGSENTLPIAEEEEEEEEVPPLNKPSQDIIQETG